MTNHDYRDRAIALAALLQAARTAQRIAETGEANAASISTLIDSVFRFDAESSADIYGGTSGIWPGLRDLIGMLERGDQRDSGIGRIAGAVLRLERRFIGNQSLSERVHVGLAEIAQEHQQQGPTHPQVLARLGELYAATVSQIEPRVQVHGNPTYLTQPQVVAEIRAVLFAALRAAVLWRQVGGNYWNLLVRRQPLLAAARELLAGH